MFPCPHCGQPIESGPQAKVAWYHYDSGRPNVSLGCGTLILIAIIVAMFSRGGDESNAIRALHKEIQVLETKIDGIAPKPALPAEVIPAREPFR